MRICVLVVDDDAPILTAIARGFAHKWTVTQCTSADDALEILEGPTLFDVIMLDLYMPPGPSGIEIFEQCATTAPARRERTIFYTGGGMRDSTIKWMNEQKRPVLMKPVNFEAIEHTVNRVVADATKNKVPRGPHFHDAPPRPRVTPVDPIDRFDALATRLEQALQNSMHDAANVRSERPAEKHHASLKSIADDDDDESAGRSSTGNHIMIPAGSWLEREVNKLLEAREKRLALELAAGRWGKLVAWWREWWKRLAMAAIALSTGIVVREIAHIVSFVAKQLH